MGGLWKCDIKRDGLTSERRKAQFVHSHMWILSCNVPYMCISEFKGE